MLCTAPFDLDDLTLLTRRCAYVVGLATSDDLSLSIISVTRSDATQIITRQLGFRFLGCGARFRRGDLLTLLADAQSLTILVPPLRFCRWNILRKFPIHLFSLHWTYSKPYKEIIALTVLSGSR